MLIHYFSWYIFYSLTSRELLISRTHINTIFCKSMMRSSRWVEMNCFDIFRFLAEVSTHLKKMHYFRQFKNHLTPFFSSAFWPLTKLIAKINFHGSYFRPFWSAKIPEFWRCKLWDQYFVSFDSGNIHIKESKKTGFIFSFELRTKVFWSHGLLLLVPEYYFA